MALKSSVFWVLMLAIITNGFGVVIYDDPEEQLDLTDIFGAQYKNYYSKDDYLVDYPNMEYLKPIEEDAPSVSDMELLQEEPYWPPIAISGGVREGKQRVGANGIIGTKQPMKTDNSLPSYCHPPNPCPEGFTAEDGCIERFENTATYSQKYQASQDCMCDTDHMYNCPSNSIEGKSFYPMAITRAGRKEKIETLPVAAKKGFFATSPLVEKQGFYFG